jgi:hypothetical protein
MAANPAVLEDLKYLPGDKLKNVHYITICNATNVQHKCVQIRGPDFLTQTGAWPLDAYKALPKRIQTELVALVSCVTPRQDCSRLDQRTRFSNINRCKVSKMHIRPYQKEFRLN